MLGAKEGIAAKAMERINEKVGHKMVVGAHIPSFGFESMRMNEGIGLRQLMDYYYVLISDDLSLIRDRVQKELKELGLWKFAGAIMYIMQEVFGLPASRLIVPPNEKYGRFVLNEVLEAGNFGKHDARNRFGRSQLGHNLQRVYRDIRLVRYFPAEALCEPLFRIWHFFWRLKHRR